MKRIAGAAALGAALLLGLPSAQAGYVVTLEEVGSDVVATGSGPLDLTGLTVSGSGNQSSVINPLFGNIITGPASPLSVVLYEGFTGPTSFGSGFFGIIANSGTGDTVGMFGSGIGSPVGQLVVPSGYVSGSPLSDTATWLDKTFSSLGVTPGTYEWTWGTGVHADSFTLVIGAVAIPEPASAALLGAALAGLLLAGTIRRRQTEA